MNEAEKAFEFDRAKAALVEAGRTAGLAFEVTALLAERAYLDQPAPAALQTSVKSKYPIGTRVEVANPALERNGHRGTVTQVDTRKKYQLIVRLDNETIVRVYAPSSVLRLPPPPAQKYNVGFQVGDRVRLTDRWHGRRGTVTQINVDKYYPIQVTVSDHIGSLGFKPDELCLLDEPSPIKPDDKVTILRPGSRIKQGTVTRIDLTKDYPVYVHCDAVSPSVAYRFDELALA